MQRDVYPNTTVFSDSLRASGVVCTCLSFSVMNLNDRHILDLSCLKQLRKLIIRPLFQHYLFESRLIYPVKLNPAERILQ